MVNTCRAIILAIVVAACEGSDPIQIDGCVAKTSEWAVDLREVSGLRFAPGGQRVYFTIGDRGINWKLEPGERSVLESAWQACRRDGKR